VLDAVTDRRLLELAGLVGLTTSRGAAEEQTAKNLLVIRDPALAARYTENWQAHAAHSELYAGRAAGMSVVRPW